MKYVKQIWKNFRTPLIFSIVMIVICGLVYPLVTTGLAQVIFPRKANGNLVDRNGNPTKSIEEAVGSELIGQEFTDPRLMKCRPSAINYNVWSDADEYEGISSGSENYSNSNPDMEARVAQSFVEFILWNMDERDIPSALLSVTEECALPEPFILPGDALVQVPAIAAATGLSEQELTQIIDANATDILNGIPAVRVIETYTWDTTLEEEDAQFLRDAIEALEASGGRMITVSKVNLDILRKMDKMVTGVDLGDIPSDLFTSTGSGFDPHISPAAARVQVPALVYHTGLSEDTLIGIIERHTTGKLAGVLGEETVNVLMVNIEIANLLGMI